MKVDIDKNRLYLKIHLAEDDLADAEGFIRIVSSPEWQRVQLRFFLPIREAILKSIKDVSASELSARMAPIKAAVFKGFEEALDIPSQIISEAARLREEKLKTEELNDDDGQPADAPE